MKIFALKEDEKRVEYAEKNGKIYRLNKPAIDLLMSENLSEIPGDEISLNFSDIVNGQKSKYNLEIPILPPEIWGTGISYYISRTRYSEDDVAKIMGKTIYELVYESERPEIFFKGTVGRCVPPFGNVAIRSDSRWTLPEPELAVCINSRGKILGYTVFDDVSARDIEAENPLFLPESKIYDGCASFGPVLVTPDEFIDPYTLDIKMRIYRNKELFFEGKTNSKNIRTKIETQIKWLMKDNSIPDGTVLTTGTSIIPGKDQGLKHGDRVEISIQGIGTLTTGVIKK